jgi:hypothetical protein
MTVYTIITKKKKAKKKRTIVVEFRTKAKLEYIANQNDSSTT